MEKGNVITTLIVLGSITIYFLIGMIICRPILKPLYNAVYEAGNPSYKTTSPESAMRQTVGWFSAIVTFWPLTFIYVICWLFARPRTPQYREHLDSVERERLKKELKEAQETIAKFDARQRATVNPPPRQRFDR